MAYRKKGRRYYKKNRSHEDEATPEGLIAAFVFLGAMYGAYIPWNWEIAFGWKVVISASIVLFALGLLSFGWLYIRVLWARKQYKKWHSILSDSGLLAEIENFILSWGNHAEKGVEQQRFGSRVFSAQRLDHFYEYIRTEKGIPLPRSAFDRVMDAVIERMDRRVTLGGLQAEPKKFESLSGAQFETLLARAYGAAGYNVLPTGKSGDQGGDLVISRDSERILVQAKRYQGSVGNAAVQQAFTAKTIYNCTSAMVVTTSHFTPDAVQAAMVTGVKLVDKGSLQQMLMESIKETWI